jgi:hypothetical protein
LDQSIKARTTEGKSDSRDGTYRTLLAKPSSYTERKSCEICCGKSVTCKESKELDDNSPTKNDVKDAKVIALLVRDGRYAEPTIPQGVYAELRVAKKIRDLLTDDLQTVQGQIHNWLDRIFPSF